MPTPDEIRQRNRRLGLVLLSVALAFMVGFMVRMTYFGG